jgi:hypothetical protein
MTRLEELTITLEALEHSRKNQFSRVGAEEYEKQIKKLNQEIKELQHGH